MKIFTFNKEDIRVKQAEQDINGNNIIDFYQTKITSENPLSITFISGLSNIASSGSYTDISNKPSINNVTLDGNKTLDDFNIQEKLLSSGDNQNIKTINGQSILGKGNITEVGPMGPTGPQGIQGEIGPTGPQGLKGEQGIDGTTGPTGPQGIQGEPGKNGSDGKTPTITISEDGYWVINGEKTTVKAQGEQGPKGDKGDQGSIGPTGSPGSMSIQYEPTDKTLIFN